MHASACDVIIGVANAAATLAGVVGAQVLVGVCALDFRRTHTGPTDHFTPYVVVRSLPRARLPTPMRVELGRRCLACAPPCLPHAKKCLPDLSQGGGQIRETLLWSARARCGRHAKQCMSNRHACRAIDNADLRTKDIGFKMDTAWHAPVTKYLTELCLRLIDLIQRFV